MKKITHLTTLILILLSNSIITNAQTVTIPDSIFKAYLVGNTSINTNADTEIQVSEAAAFTGSINVQNKNISSLVGIEAFSALTNLNCSVNQLTALNLSTNTALTHLSCFSNQLTSLDLSTNTALLNITCFSNQLTSLNLSNNTSLYILQCFNNQLTALDLSANIQLTEIKCHANQLTSLNVKNGANTNISTADFNAIGNSNLSCIQVDDTTYSNTNWTNISPSSTFSTDCAAFLGTTSFSNTTQDVKVFPNPFTNNLNIKLDKNYNNVMIELNNSLGQVVLSRAYHNTNQIELDLNQPSGLFFVKIQTEEGEATLKVFRQ